MIGKGYCLVCGTPFSPDSRSDKLTCSDICRSRRARYKQKIANLVTEALNAIFDVAAMSQGEQFADLAFAEVEFLVEYAKAVHADLTMQQPPREWWSK